MYGLDMYHTIKVLLEQGHSERSVARQLNIHRKTVRQIRLRISNKEGPPTYERESKLAPYKKLIEKWLHKDGLSRVLIRERLRDRHDVKISYSRLCAFIRSLSPPEESHVPMHSAAGEEAQVDFGYLGKFEDDDGRKIKVWCFCMCLSNSRHSYNEVVRDQRVATFLRCHRNAFEFFNGVPKRVLLDNLKSGVITPDFYEPLLQEQYAEFLAHYGCAGVPCRVYTPEHKGKVESLVKYVKGNFVKRLVKAEYQWKGLQTKLHKWTKEVANVRKHGTTHQVPQQVFDQEEQAALQPLPPHPYEFLRWEERKINRFGHLTFENNYYSVPSQYVGQTLRVQTNGQIVRIYQGQEQVALHELAGGKGTYITRPEHLPAHKRQRSLQELQIKVQGIGASAVNWMEACMQRQPYHWRDKIRGILSLKRHYEATQINQACQLALVHDLLTYQSVKRICQQRKKVQQQEQNVSISSSQLVTSDRGYHHQLAHYDQL